MKYVIGIDLGTTNSVLAYAPLDADRPQVEVLPIPQLVAADGRAQDDAAVVSVSGASARAGARLCRGRRQRLRGRRRARGRRPRCPSERWPRPRGGSPTAGRSPSADPAVERAGGRAQRSRRSRRRGGIWSTWSPPGTRHPDAPLAEQQVVLTVPASFDAAARELTREAALAAGLPRATLSCSKSRRRPSTPGSTTWASAGGEL